ncbi:hypothetical protein B0T25DRAFT_177344 [Lasiosphaeria hispida]|uniref:Uncharacterized protein n=1 Tax=Lasiosphaeria hispida TaxID=260671 RepID=A0AAJ0HP17_9PEZI|nr:hypothetical protein B0T25DRAFT_177344 [Lasiosphaeria hispida]
MDTATTAGCELNGNADFYGLGIRLGIYLQWVSTLLVTLFLPEEEAVYCSINIILQVAIAATVALLTTQTKLLAVEAVIAFWLQFGALSSLTGDGISPFGTATGTARMLIYTAVCAYGCWFWYGGAARLLQTGCAAVAFFGRAALTSWFQPFCRTASITGLVVCFALLLVSGWQYVHGHDIGDDQRLRQRPTTDVLFLLLSIFIIAMSVVSVEYLIRANSMSELDDFFAVGQLIPFLIGLFGLVNTLVSISRQGRMLRPRCWVILWKHLS